LTFEEYFKQGRMDAAVPLLDRLAVLDPNGPITRMFAGISHAKALQHITAVREYYAALGQGGDPEKVCPLLVRSLLAMDNVEEAATVIAGYYQKAPASIPLAKAYADVALRQQDTRRARSLLELVPEKEPYLQAQNMSLARIYWTAGEREAAARCLVRVVQASPQDIPARALLGEYHLGKGDPAAAITVLQPRCCSRRWPAHRRTPRSRPACNPCWAPHISRRGAGKRRRGDWPKPRRWPARRVNSCPASSTSSPSKRT
jgi:Flp pilus assembly protein TadD